MVTLQAARTQVSIGPETQALYPANDPFIAGIAVLPSAFARMAAQFDRIGETDLTRAGDELRWLWVNLPCAPASEWLGRAARFRSAVDWLITNRSECVDDLICVGSDIKVALRIAPDIIESMARRSQQARSAACA